MNFFDQMSPEQRQFIKAVAMDMWEPFIEADKKKLPQAKVVFDLFHVAGAFGRVIDKVRNAEFKKGLRGKYSCIQGGQVFAVKKP
jgi:transposase